MLRSVSTGPKSLDDYRPFVVDEVIDEIHALVDKLSGTKILHINSTEKGGGVAEILKTLVPLAKSTDLEVDWQVLEADTDFYVVTKAIHNGLQGKGAEIKPNEWRLFESINKEAAQSLGEYDVIIVHDPQPAAIKQFKSNKAKWIWRYHGDATQANPEISEKMAAYTSDYDGYIYTLKDYQLDKSPNPHEFIYPTIDPLAIKNQFMDRSDARDYLSKYGLNTDKPIISQVSRFDPWKDPLGVIDVWQSVSQKIEGAQLILRGNKADDDPEGEIILKQVLDKASKYDDIFVLHDIPQEDNDELVRAIFAGSDVVLQKSLREGFGLTVTEAMNQGAIVVGRKVGGIAVQIEDGDNGFLGNSDEQVTEKVVQILDGAYDLEKISMKARESVSQKLYTPHQLRDQLRFISKLIK